MGSQKCRIVGKSQSVMIVIHPILFTRTLSSLDTQRDPLTAVRLAGQMNRDWIQTGRRPAGICGVRQAFPSLIPGPF
eukprot:COSAG01_NODE_10107_length_2249_cov_2.181395_2_plen_77_part_00